eukprot:CAMPEP_0115118084 /NCGR_PEP_ID=MMETSP0227-20121206/44278_1 /TAXON_ID=89957 /ORGANISM="Polarella glacialis, Strain CCMP 1383" /LENGTH=363 /DNA_ID=CAMNT_0002519281 /DNA_START=33 /DNA_END=1125 /DNA_ORIENTATION=+
MAPQFLALLASQVAFFPAVVLFPAASSEILHAASLGADDECVDNNHHDNNNDNNNDKHNNNKHNSNCAVSALQQHSRQRRLAVSPAAEGAAHWLLEAMPVEEEGAVTAGNNNSNNSNNNSNNSNNSNNNSNNTNGAQSSGNFSCGGQPYEVATEGCCAESLYSLTTQGCCGEDPANSSASVYSFLSQGCCDKRSVYQLGTSSCGAEDSAIKTKFLCEPGWPPAASAPYWRRYCAAKMHYAWAMTPSCTWGWLVTGISSADEATAMALKNCSARAAASGEECHVFDLDGSHCHKQRCGEKLYDAAVQGCCAGKAVYLLANEAAAIRKSSAQAKQAAAQAPSSGRAARAAAETRRSSTPAPTVAA